MGAEARAELAELLCLVTVDKLRVTEIPCCAAGDGIAQRVDYGYLLFHRRREAVFGLLRMEFSHIFDGNTRSPLLCKLKERRIEVDVGAHILLKAHFVVFGRRLRVCRDIANAELRACDYRAANALGVKRTVFVGDLLLGTVEVGVVGRV